MRGYRLKTILVATTCLCAAGSAQAADAVWNGGVGNWNDATKWTPASVPNDIALGTASTVVKIDGSKTGTASVVTLNQNSTIGTLQIDAGDTLTFQDGRKLNMNPFVVDFMNPTWVNDGSINVSSTGTTTGFRLGIGAFTTHLNGNGVINLSNNVNNVIEGTGAGPFDTPSLENHSNTIQGSGRIGNASGLNQLRFINHGLVDANSSGGLTVGFRGFAQDTGTYRASNGGTLTLEGVGIQATVHQNGGVGVVENLGATVNVNDATTDDGLFTNSLVGQVNLNGGGINWLVGGTINNGVQATITAVSGDSRIGGQINNGGAITIADGAILEFYGLPNATNTGQINVNGASNITTFAVGQNLTLSGGGLIHFTDSANNRVDKNVQNTHNRIVNEDNTIDGAFEWNRVALINRGTVDSNASNGMVIRPRMQGAPDGGPFGITNSGTMQANGGKLTISGVPASFAALVTNFEGADQGHIRALSSEVELNTAQVTGGVVETVGTGALTLRGASVLTATVNNASQGVIRSASGDNQIGGTITNAAGGLIIVDAGTDLRVSGGSTVTNNSDIQVNNAKFGLQGFNQNVILTGGGTVHFNNDATNAMRGGFGNERLTNENNTITGSVEIGQNNMYLTNRGVIDSDASGGMIMRLRNNATTFNFNTDGGIIRASNGSTLQLGNSTLVNSGGTLSALANSTVHILADGGVKGGLLSTAMTGQILNAGLVVADAANAMTIIPGSSSSFVNSGTVRVDAGGAMTVLGGYTQTAGLTQVNGTLANDQAIVIADGLLTGTGVVTGTVVNSGAVNPGASPGVLRIGDDYTQDLDGIFNVEIGGEAIGLFDRLEIGDRATLDGILNITLFGGFTADAGDEFEIMTFARRVGEFDMVNGLNFAPGLAFEVDYGDTDVTLRVLAVVAAPEPGSIAAFAGALTLLFRVRRRRSR